MTSMLLYSIAVTGFTVAFMHAALPTHWFPFVMTARAHHWSNSKALTVTALAGLGHVLLTSILGFVIVWLGVSIDQKVGRFFPYIAGGALILFGLFNLLRQMRGHGHRHLFGGHHHSHGPHEALTGKLSDRAAILSLVMMLTFSPCESFLPVYFSGIAMGWQGFIILSAILAVGTLAGMALFTWLTLMGLERIKLTILEKYEHLTMGIVLCVIGVFVIIVES